VIITLVHQYFIINYIPQDRNLVFGSPIIILDTFWTDVSGNFSYSFYNETGYIYYLVAGHDNSYTRFDDYDVDYNKTNTFEIKVKPYRVIELELVNKTGRYREISIWQAEIYNIQFLDTTIFLDKIIPEEEYTLYIWLYENSEDIPIALEEHFTINNVDTTSFKLNY